VIKINDEYVLASLKVVLSLHSESKVSRA